ncbi:uncharacterized protein LOC122055360 [Zingiber officinale]|uniref:Uncharacterized protein n=1 Tax=Zingiber officinale TaxID=94328 RepID=A0A8J5LGK3_ZINOF|nr:uncharacterized protein LOC122055360 [Zingiber officinale]KAG6516920.1 hypothetical protein ZIOFF_020295 [Zingiber officinale]
MGLFRRIAGFFGLSREDEEEGVDIRRAKGEGSGGADDGAGPPARTAAGGFGVQVPVAVERPNLGSVLVPCDPGEGGIQGFRWYARRLRMDEDGDVADEFLSEVKTEMLPMENQMTPPKLQAKYNTRSTAMAMRKQVIVADGNIHQSLEYQGRLQWV